MSEPTIPDLRLTKAQWTALRWAKNKFTDGRVPSFVFRDYRSVLFLLSAGVIENWKGYGAVMYKFTESGEALIQRGPKEKVKR